MSLLARWLAVVAAIQAFVGSHALATIGLVIFAEEIGIPFLFPGDLTMIVAGIQVRDGHAALWTVLLIEEAATLSGALTLFWISRRLGLPVIQRFGKYLGLRDEHLERAQARMHRHEMSTVLLGRLVPGFRVIVVIAAGVSQVSGWRFVTGLTIGSFLYVLTYTLLGLWVGAPVLGLIAKFALPASSLWSLGALVLLALGMRVLRSSPATRDALQAWPQMFLLAGLVAGIAGLLAGNVVVGAVSVVVPAALFSGSLSSGGWGLLFSWPSFLIAVLLLSWAYRALLIRGAPWYARAVAVGLPIAAMLITVDPLGDLLGTGTSISGALTTLAVNIARWLTFIAVFELMPHPSRPRRWGE